MLLATLRGVILSSMVGIVCHRLLGGRDLEVKVVQDGTHGTFCSLLAVRLCLAHMAQSVSARNVDARSVLQHRLQLNSHHGVRSQTK
jgi:hypothetical protein